MRDRYEYIAIYVDDLLIASQEPIAILQDKKQKFKLKIKGDRPLEYHLGCDYKLDKDGTLIAQPTKYITKILRSFKKMFQVKTSLTQNFHLRRMIIENLTILNHAMKNRSHNT